MGAYVDSGGAGLISVAKTVVVNVPANVVPGGCLVALNRAAPCCVTNPADNKRCRVNLHRQLCTILNSFSVINLLVIQPKLRPAKMAHGRPETVSKKTVKSARENGGVRGFWWCRAYFRRRNSYR